MEPSSVVLPDVGFNFVDFLNQAISMLGTDAQIICTLFLFLGLVIMIWRFFRSMY